ncbi:MAG: hypothetical protein U0263_06440 [Polyangiaceae bacterium]
MQTLGLMAALFALGCAGGEAGLTPSDGGAEPDSGTGGASAGPACAASEKACTGACVSVNDPEHGCSGTSCAPCSTPNATAGCTKAGCSIAACNAGHADCDGERANGCEVSTADDPAHCGACGHACSTAGGSAKCVAGVCATACDQGRADCDGQPENGCETELLTDAQHCGACGHDCQGTSCSVGLCAATWLTEEPAGANCAGPLAVDGGDVFFVSGDGALKKVKTGGTPEVLLPGAGRTLHDMALDSTHLYLLDTFKREVLRLPRLGGASEKIGSFTDYFVKTTNVYVVTDGTQVFWLDHVSGVVNDIKRYKLPAGPEVVWRSAGAQATVFDIALFGEYLYWIEDDAIWRAKAAQANAVPELVAPSIVASRLAVGGGALHWIGQASKQPTEKPGVVRLGAGGTPELLSESANVIALAPEPSEVFFRTGLPLSGDTRLLRVLPGQADALPIVTDKSKLGEAFYERSIAVDSKFLYANVPCKKGVLRVAR